MRVVGTVMVVAVGLAIACVGGPAADEDARSSGVPSAQGGSESAGGAASGGSNAGECAEPSELKSLQECDAGDSGCYALSEEWRLWGPTELSPESTTCHFHPFDRCGCPVGQAGAGGAGDGGSGAEAGADATGEIERCAEGERCIANYVESINAYGPVGELNVCAKVCLSDGDCTAPERCVAGACYEPECVGDSDCDRDACGQCAPNRAVRHGGVTYPTRSPTCVYEGPCNPASCEGCSDRTQDYGVPVHACDAADG